MRFEYELLLNDGRVVNVVGEADICGTEADEDFMIFIEVESATLVINDGADEWLEVEPSMSVTREIEKKVIARILAERAEEAA